MILFTVTHIWKCNKLLNNIILMEKNYEKENDERKVFIDGSVGSLCCKIFNYCIFISTLIANFINITIFAVLSVVLLYTLQLFFWIGTVLIPIHTVPPFFTYNLSI